MRPDLNAPRHVLEDAGITTDAVDERFGVVCRVTAEDVPATLIALEADGYEMLVDLFAVDTGKALEITYHLRSFFADTEVYIRTGVPYEGAVGSVWRSHPAALYPERETAELFGLSFPGHPNPKRLLTSDKVEEPLMRRAVPTRSHEEVMRDVPDA